MIFPIHKEGESKDFSFWEDVIFTETGKFNLFGSDGRPYVWRRSNEKLLSKNMKHGGSVMVWGSFCGYGPGVVHFIDDTMD